MNKGKLTVVGHSVSKVDAIDKVLGRAVCAEDITFPSVVHKNIPGVICVLTTKDVPGFWKDSNFAFLRFVRLLKGI